MEAASLPRPGRYAALGALAALLVLLFAVAPLAGLLGEQGCGGSTSPSSKAGDDIPADFLALYQQQGSRFGIPWPILAGIGKEECDHGRYADASCRPEPGAAGPGAANFAGAAGPMQIGVGGAAGCTFCTVKVDGGGDGKIGTHDPADAIAMAAKVLLAKGAPRDQPFDAYRAAVTAYNGAGPAAVAYADRVLADARAYSSGDVTVAASAGCSSDAIAATGASGPVQVAPGANRPGAPLTPELLNYVRAMAGLYGKPIVISTGTNHSQFTVDGNVSDHWDGHGADLGMAANGGTIDGPVGDQLMTACLIVAGVPPPTAASEASQGGLYTLIHDGMRIQCIWKTYAGGDHHNHVHVGVRHA